MNARLKRAGKWFLFLYPFFLVALSLAFGIKAFRNGGAAHLPTSDYVELLRQNIIAAIGCLILGFVVTFVEKHPDPAAGDAAVQRQKRN